VFEEDFVAVFGVGECPVSAPDWSLEEVHKGLVQVWPFEGTGFVRRGDANDVGKGVHGADEGESGEVGLLANKADDGSSEKQQVIFEVVSDEAGGLKG
jgi:hypothetical protein